MYEVEGTNEFQVWYSAIDIDDPALERVNTLVDALAEHGPALGRPAVGKISGSRHHHLKELRSGSIRIIFAFDPRQTAILLLGADKAQHGWKAWYSKAIPMAEDLYDEYLKETAQ